MFSRCVFGLDRKMSTLMKHNENRIQTRNVHIHLAFVPLINLLSFMTRFVLNAMKYWLKFSHLINSQMINFRSLVITFSNSFNSLCCFAPQLVQVTFHSINSRQLTIRLSTKNMFSFNLNHYRSDMESTWHFWTFYRITNNQFRKTRHLI